MRSIDYTLRFIFVLLLALTGLRGQKLPDGANNPIRQRTYDIVHFRADLVFDLAGRSLTGDVAVTAKLLTKGASIKLDAYHLDVSAVTLGTELTPLEYTNDSHELLIQLPRTYQPAEAFTVNVTYAASPKAGMLFQSDWADTSKIYVHTYGEGGMHANWLPIYNSENDKFTSEMIITVPTPNVAIANGVLIGQGETDTTNTYHYRQDKVHSSYLIAVYIGEFEQAALEPAFGTIPINYWVPAGRLEEGAYAFRNTTRMVEHFSDLLGYRYPWVKYDQIAVPDYAIGAMEHTGVTGHNISVLRKSSADAPLDFGGPDFGEYYTDWSAEATISHELAHHWFGDNLTCASLGYIWLNESFASYMMMLWDEELYGPEQLDFAVVLAKRHYTEYVAAQHIIRPLEYHKFDSPTDIYNTEHTYLKGGVALHMLRNVMGDEAFFKGLRHYLEQNEFASVVSADLHQALEESSELDLDWFFDEWITGGGHPQFEVSYRYLAEPGLIDLKVVQIQPLVEGQGIFNLPVNITIAGGGKQRTKQIQVSQASEHFLIESDSEPEMVSFDGDGTLVAEIFFDKSASEWAYQATHDNLAGRFRAITSLASNYPRASITARTFGKILRTAAYWGDRAETASLLAQLDEKLGLKLIKVALKNTDYRVRKGAVIALGQFDSPAAGKLLKRVVKTESHPDVLATAINNSDNSVRLAHFNDQAWYDEITIGALQGLTGLTGQAEIEAVASMTDQRYNMDVRRAALKAWVEAAPNDRDLHATIARMAKGGPYPLQKEALKLAGKLNIETLLPYLEKLVERMIDPNLTQLAKQAIEDIERISAVDK